MDWASFQRSLLQVGSGYTPNPALNTWGCLLNASWPPPLPLQPLQTSLLDRIKGEVTVMSMEAFSPLSQLKTSTSAGWVRLKYGVMSLPDSTLTPRWARWQNPTITLCRWLWRVTTSPPCLQVVAWLPRRSRAMPGQKEHEEPLAVSFPSYHWMEIFSSLRSRCRLSQKKV